MFDRATDFSVAAHGNETETKFSFKSYYSKRQKLMMRVVGRTRRTHFSAHLPLTTRLKT